uniref:U13-Saltitoxin-Pre1a_1 n=1 Tax=Phidippus regius TaxID=1905328 RepID=A0A482ZGV5_9ARAC
MHRAVVIFAVAVMVVSIVSGQEQENCGMSFRPCRDNECCVRGNMVDYCSRMPRERQFCEVEPRYSCPCRNGLQCARSFGNYGRCQQSELTTSSTMSSMSTDSGTMSTDSGTMTTESGTVTTDSASTER